MSLITLPDGSMGQELVRRLGDKPTPLGATRVMIDHPGMVQTIHADYFAAGGGCATGPAHIAELARRPSAAGHSIA